MSGGYQALNSFIVEEGKVVVNPEDPSNSIRVKAIVNGRYKHFTVPVTCKLNYLIDRINLHKKSETYSLSTAYILWFLCGFLGIHRFYLKQHSGLTWFVWLITGQLFGLGWLFDGFTMPVRVRKLNSSNPVKSQSALFQFAFGKRDDLEPNMIVAYLLWFFFGFFGIHRWYTGYHTPSSWVTWTVTGQMFVVGWFFDIYYTQYMVRNPKDEEYGNIHLKYHEDRDYMPLQDDPMLATAIRQACLRPDRTVRILAMEKKQESMAYIAWFFLGILGFHAQYLRLPFPFVRIFTLNYLLVGWLVDGINLQKMVHQSNEEMLDDFIPSKDGGGIWPHARVGSNPTAKDAVEIGTAIIGFAKAAAGK